MTASKVRADYEQLTEIAQAFGQRAETAQRVLGALQKDMGALEGGDWLGKGSEAFYAEMNSAVLPSMERLVAALNEAASTTQKVSLIMKQAEDDSAALFRLEGVAAGKGANGGLAPGGWADGSPANAIRTRKGGSGSGSASGGSGGSGAPAKGQSDKAKTDPAPKADPKADAAWQERVARQITIRDAKRNDYFKARVAQSQSWDWKEVKKHVDQRIADRQRLVRLFAEIEVERLKNFKKTGRNDPDWIFQKFNEWHELADKFRVDSEVDRTRTLQLVTEATANGASDKTLKEMRDTAQSFKEINVGNDILKWQAAQEDIYPKELGGKGKEK